MEILQIFSWPGNVRELENVVRRAAILAQSESRDLIQTKDLPLELTESSSQKDEMVQRILDLRDFTKQNKILFWKAIEKGANKLSELGNTYSILKPDRINELISMHKRISSQINLE